MTPAGRETHNRSLSNDLLNNVMGFTFWANKRNHKEQFEIKDEIGYCWTNQNISKSTERRRYGEFEKCGQSEHTKEDGLIQLRLTEWMHKAWYQS